MLAVDIEHSSGRGNAPLLEIREALFTALRESVVRSEIDWETCLRDDLGDGIRMIPPAGTRKSHLIHPLIHELAVRLEAHNRTPDPSTRIRVRVALHAGDVFLGPGGEVAGQPLEILARMLDAPPTRKALARAPRTVPVSVLISQHFYDETVRHGYPGIDPDTFQKVTFTEKNYTADAWLHLPNYSLAPQVKPPDVTASDQPPARSKTVNRASGNGTIYAAHNGNQNIYTDGRS